MKTKQNDKKYQSKPVLLCNVVVVLGYKQNYNGKQNERFSRWVDLIQNFQTKLYSVSYARKREEQYRKTIERGMNMRVMVIDIQLRQWLCIYSALYE